MKIKLFKDINLKGYDLIEGFPSPGLVGTMAVEYLIDKLNMQNIGFIYSDRFPMIISIHNGTIMPPIRIYASEKLKLLAILSEVAIPPELLYIAGRSLKRFIVDNKIDKTISIVGFMISRDIDRNKAYGIGFPKDLNKDLESKGIEVIKEGAFTGVNSAIINNLLLDDYSNVKIYNIMVPIIQELIDPKYAEIAIKAVNDLLDINIDITELEKESKLLNEKIREVLNKSKQAHENYKRVGITEHNQMYG
ncbi:MAG: proteasome assembly chaperone family protein [Candidatus Micrarchaeota archaeon]|nr:MAG: proteasome assembly chaperone family protein [Candidatus Micrarchaeota archaeon]